MSNRLRISLVIPAYNEESHLVECLQSALRQRIPFDEIIVVDNNSTDATARIARSFPSITLLHDPQQGVVHARNRGMRAATGDILARIDADTRLPTNWTHQLVWAFEDMDTDAVTGSLHYYDLAPPNLVDVIDRRARAWLARKMTTHTFLLGANMAVRRAAWEKVQSDLCADRGLHEDLDLAVHLGNAGLQVRYDECLLADVSGRRTDTNLVSFLQYMRSMPRTYAVHGRRESRYLYPIMAALLILYVPLRVLYRWHELRAESFSFSRILGLHPKRANPVTFID